VAVLRLKWPIIRVDISSIMIAHVSDKFLSSLRIQRFKILRKGRAVWPQYTNVTDRRQTYRGTDRLLVTPDERNVTQTPKSCNYSATKYTYDRRTG